MVDIDENAVRVQVTMKHPRSIEKVQNGQEMERHEQGVLLRRLMREQGKRLRSVSVSQKQQSSR